MIDREQHICDNMGLVHACCKRFLGRGIEYDDLFQAGCMGLVKATDGFEEERGLRFSTYAVPKIAGEIRRFLRGLSSMRPLWLPVWMSPVEPAEMGDLFASPLPPEELYADQLATWERNRHLSLPEQAQAFFVEHYLSGDILVKTDRASMLSSLESRAVFLDNDIADFCRRLPFRFKIRAT